MANFYKLKGDRYLSLRSINYPVGWILFTADINWDPNGYLIGTWTRLTGKYIIGCDPSATGWEHSYVHSWGSWNPSVGSTTLTAAQSGLPWHYHDASGSYSGSNFYIRHGINANTDTVAGGWNTWIDEGVGERWGNGFSIGTYSHLIDRVNIGGTVSVSVSGNGAWDASEGHTHSGATYPAPTQALCIWWRSS